MTEIRHTETLTSGKFTTWVDGTQAGEMTYLHQTETQQAGQHNNRHINALLRQLQNTTPATAQEQKQFYDRATAYLQKNNKA